MRCNVDSQALGDPRVKRLARALGIDWREALGRLVVLWMAAYEARSALMLAGDADIVTERDGFGAALVAAGLADAMGDMLRVRGVADRIAFLERQRDRASRGGRASTQKRGAQANAQADGQPLVRDALKPSLDPDLDLDLGEYSAAAVPAAPPARSSFADRALVLAMAAVEAVNARAGTAYRADTQSTSKDCAALAKAGATADDVRAVIAAKWAEWGASDKMRAQFKPSTLLRPVNFARYRDDLAATRATRAAVAPVVIADSEQIMIAGQVYDVPRDEVTS